MSCQTADKRSPLETAVAIAERFMKISPAPETYMYNIGMTGILDLWEASREDRYLDFYIAHNRLRNVRFDWHLYLATGDEQWLDGLEEAAEKFLSNPRRDREGALVDGIGRYTIDMFSGHISTPIVFGHLLKDHRFFDDSMKNFEVYRGYLEEPTTGLWYSRWGHSLHPNRPNPGLWCRGNGWLAQAWGRVMHLWDSAHHGYQEMIEAWQCYCRSIAAFQAPSGLFHQLLNRKDSFEDATGSGLFCSGFSKGTLHGTLPEEFGPIAYRDFCGLRGLVDEEGNIHNTSTYAGGYNFEQQYYSCARFDDPHGDGTVMSGCVAMHMLLKERPDMETTEPSEPPHIITEYVPNIVSNVHVERRPEEEIAAPVLKRVLALKNLPENDIFGSTILGLLHWYDNVKDKSLIAGALRLLGRCEKRLSPGTRWNLTAEIYMRTGEKEKLDGMVECVDAELRRAPRDRAGVLLDEAGGYSVETLMSWLPLLSKAAALSGDDRYLREACAQLFAHQRWLEDPLTYLWHSAYGHGAHPRRVTPGLWGLGNGYCLAAIVSLLEHLPREHDAYLDVVHMLRCFVTAVHRHEAAWGGWTQLLEDFKSFPCAACTALFAFGGAKATLNGWVHSGYHAIVDGGLHDLSGRVDEKGNVKAASLPTGGLDTLEAYQTHRAENDPAVLGHILSACGYGAQSGRLRLDPNTRVTGLGPR